MARIWVVMVALGALLAVHASVAHELVVRENWQEQGDAGDALQALVREVSLALMAADRDRIADVSDHIHKADMAAETLDAQPALDKPLHLVRLTYVVKRPDRHFRQERFVFFPFGDESFAVDDLAAGAQPKMTIRRKDAMVTFMHVDMDTGKVRNALNQAQQALADHNYADAALMLEGILVGRIGREEAKAGDALQSSYDHLVLADKLLHQQEFAYSRLALKHARKELKRYSMIMKGKQNDEQIGAMGNEIDKLSLELKKEDPNMLQRAQAKIKGWIETVRGWIKIHVPVHEAY